MPIANVNPNLFGTMTSPVMESRRWIEGMIFPDDKPLINVSQAAPIDPPPAPLREALADAVLNDVDSHLYGAVLGMDTLRKEVAHQWSTSYRGKLGQENVGITSGCNQAFCAAISSLCGPGDAVILPAPWYFNHKMWLDMAGIECRVLMCGEDMLPSAEEAVSLINNKVKAIVLVTPNNPCGVEYPPLLMDAFYELAKNAGISLVVDETYRDFHSRTGAAHALFERHDWQKYLIQLYSFSKAYRLTGHRVGAVISSAKRLAEIEKFLDTLTICPNQLGQRGALFGMRNLEGWLGDERAEILGRRAAMVEGFKNLEGWKLKGCGAYFAYVSHPFLDSSDIVAQRLVKEASILALPGTMFSPILTKGGTGHAEAHFRIAFANIDRAEIGNLFERLEALDV
ncbi:MAG: aminotransferase [Amylibacter sp.]|nr:aminotransferase [Amylibacter sp.]